LLFHVPASSFPPAIKMVCSLLSLPIELLRIISHDLDYVSTVALKWTCRYLYRAIQVPGSVPNGLEGTCSRAYSMTDLLRIERWPCYHLFAAHPDDVFKQPTESHDFFACSICLKIRPARRFTNAMMKGRRGKLSPSLDLEGTTRFCIPCGIKTGRYVRGTSFKFGGRGGDCGFICLACGVFAEETFPMDKTCMGCWSHKHFRDLQRNKITAVT
jgi:hypothetical protein